MPQLTRQVPDGAIVPGFNDEAVTAIAAKRLVGHDAAAGKYGVQLAVTATTKLVGVTMESIAAGRLGDVQKAGDGILTAGVGGVAIGDRVTADAAGKGIVTTTEDNTVAGEALTAAAADADFTIRLMIGSHVP